MSPERLARVRERARPVLEFDPVPGVNRAIFIAVPHRGTEVAGNRLARWVSGLVQLFAALGLNSDVCTLSRGGRAQIWLVALASGFMVLQSPSA